MNPAELISPHDRFFKESMERIDIAQGLSKLLLPKLISIQINYSSLKIEKDSWINSMLIQHCADVLYRAETEDTAQQLLLLFEHKSYVDTSVALQNYRNTSEIFEEEQKQKKSSTQKLPTVIPVIIYHGNLPWNRSNSINTIFEIIKGAEQYIPQQRNVIIDLNSISDEDIEGIVEVKAFILALKYSRSPVLFEKLPEIINLFRGMGVQRQRYLEVVIWYLNYVVPKDKRVEFSKIVERELKLGDEEMKKSSNIWAELGYCAGKDDGLKEGENIGFSKGENVGFSKGER